MKQLVKLKWVWKLLRADNYVVLTDKESVICFNGMKDPDTINNQLILAGQASAVQYFAENLTKLSKQHAKAIAKLNKKGKRGKKTHKGIA